MMTGTKRPFGPTIEKPNPDPFITREPYDVLVSGDYADVPAIIGYCNREGNLSEGFANMLEDRKPIHTEFDDLVPCDLNISKESVQFKELAKKVYEFYYNNGHRDTTETYSIVSMKVFLKKQSESNIL